MQLAFAHFDADQAPRWFEAATNWTTAAERQTALLRTGAEAQAQYLVGRASLRLTVVEYTGAADRSLRIAVDDEGKPYLPSFPNLYVSVAHCTGYVTTAICDGAPAGIDVEVPSGEASQALAIAERMFDAAEAKLLAETEETRLLSDFWRYWTCKEATGKAGCVGLARALRSAVIDLSAVQPRLSAVGFGPPVQQWSLFHSRLDQTDSQQWIGETAAPEVICAVAIAMAGVRPVAPRQLNLSELQ